MRTATAIAKCVGFVLNAGYKRATAYMSKDHTIKATARGYSHRQCEAVVTIGKPNFMEREFIRDCVEAGVKFPLRKIQLKAWTPKRRAKK